MRGLGREVEQSPRCLLWKVLVKVGKERGVSEVPQVRCRVSHDVALPGKEVHLVTVAVVTSVAAGEIA